MINLTNRFAELIEAVKTASIDLKWTFEAINNEKAEKLQEIKQTYIPQSAAFNEAVKKAEADCRAKIDKIKVEAITEIIDLSESLKKEELDEVAKIDKTSLDYIAALSDIPLTIAELQTLNDKYDSYWTSRALSQLAEKNGIDSLTIGIKPSFDTKKAIIDEIEDNFIKCAEIYSVGKKKHSTEELKAIAGISPQVLDRALEAYSGMKEGEGDISAVVSKSLLNLKMQTNDIQKGITAGNILRNNSKNPAMLNKLLYEFSTDETISPIASKISGFDEVLQGFKNGKGEEYKRAESAFNDVKDATDEKAIATAISKNAKNKFFADMLNAGASTGASKALVTAWKNYNDINS